MRSVAYLGLGSNMGDRVGMIAAALAALGATEAVRRIARVSHAYESEPWGVAGQPRFANAVALVEYDGEARDLLADVQAIERRLGRVPGERYGPRAIDIDVLLFGDEEWDSADLTIPHPRILERDFVVTPLLEIARDVVLPDGRAIDAGRATEGRVTGVLGTVPGFEEITGAPGGGGEDAEGSVESADAERGAAVGDAPSPARATGSEAIGEWVPVGPARWERMGSVATTDFDPLFYETVLIQAGIPCHFLPHRPNEGFQTAWEVPTAVRLMVPASRAKEARDLIEAVAAVEPEPEPDG